MWLFIILRLLINFWLLVILYEENNWVFLKILTMFTTFIFITWEAGVNISVSMSAQLWSQRNVFLTKNLDFLNTIFNKINLKLVNIYRVWKYQLIILNALLWIHTISSDVFWTGERNECNQNKAPTDSQWSCHFHGWWNCDKIQKILSWPFIDRIGEIG